VKDVVLIGGHDWLAYVPDVLIFFSDLIDSIDVGINWVFHSKFNNPWWGHHVRVKVVSVSVVVEDCSHVFVGDHCPVLALKICILRRLKDHNKVGVLAENDGLAIHEHSKPGIFLRII
jgi:hypothetical protein